MPRDVWVVLEMHKTSFKMCFRHPKNFKSDHIDLPYLFVNSVRITVGQPNSHVWQQSNSSLKLRHPPHRRMAGPGLHFAIKIVINTSPSIVVPRRIIMNGNAVLGTMVISNV